MAPPGRRPGRRTAVVCGAGGLAVGALAIVPGLHSNLERRYRLPILVAGVTWVVISVVLLGVLALWPRLGPRPRRLLPVIGGILVLAPLAIVVVIVVLTSDAGALLGTVERRRRGRLLRWCRRILGALAIGTAGALYAGVVSDSAAGAVGGLVSASALGIAALVTIDAIAARRTGGAVSSVPTRA